MRKLFPALIAALLIAAIPAAWGVSVNGLGPQWHTTRFNATGTYVPQTSVVWVDGVGGGGSGGGGQGSAGTAGGGGGGAGQAAVNCPLRVTPGVALTITIAASVAGVGVDTNGNFGNSTTITGGLDSFTLVGAATGGLKGASGTGGGGGAGGPVNSGEAGGAAGTSQNTVPLSIGCVIQGGGGGGGGATAGSGGNGAPAPLPGNRGLAGSGNGAGGGGGASYWAIGANGGIAAANGVDAAGNSGAGGGGAGTNATISGAGGSGFIIIRELY